MCTAGGRLERKESPDVIVFFPYIVFPHTQNERDRFILKPDSRANTLQSETLDNLERQSAHPIQPQRKIRASCSISDRSREKIDYRVSIIGVPLTRRLNCGSGVTKRNCGNAGAALRFGEFTTDNMV